jgi:cell division septum initiation protein DivIVA
MALKERASALQAQVNTQTDREQAVQAALVTAQELRADIRDQAQREAESVVKAAETEGRRLVAEAEAEARTMLRDAERHFDKLEDAIQMLDHRRIRFLKEFRQLLQREMDVVAVEEARQPMEERAIDLDLGARRTDEQKTAPETQREAPTPAKPAPPSAAPPSPPPHQPRPDHLILYLDADADDASR